ncbi:hypothetical protein AcetOrient_orf03663 [Acetobacter orientalis]|uniref:Uncharacterized protein n=1 Tax=Acetobacter orientalis TaxID=146474 RepID=A0A2Z5ZJT1_9PROT|nr:hypothetical protein AcetOrient_orf03663 [Acetobacter orientalis]
MKRVQQRMMQEPFKCSMTAIILRDSKIRNVKILPIFWRFYK